MPHALSQAIPEAVIITTLVVMLVLLTGIGVLVIRCFVKPESGKAVIRKGVGGTRVSFEGVFVIPVLHIFEKIDLTQKTIRVERQNKKGVVFACKQAAAITADFVIQISHEPTSVSASANFFGCEKASNIEALTHHFAPQFEDALETVAARTTFDKANRDRASFRNEIMESVGHDLDGFMLHDLRIYQFRSQAN